MRMIGGLSSSGGATTRESYLVESSATADLAQLLHTATRVSGADQGPPALLDIEEQGSPAEGRSAVQASIVPRRSNPFATVTLRTRRPVLGELDDIALARSVVSQFGGRRYVSLSVSSRTKRAGTFEVSAWAAGFFRLCSVNDVSLPRLMTLEQADLFADVLDILGVDFERRGARFAIVEKQWRLPISVGALVRAYETARRRSSVALYSAPLPLVQSVRIERGIEQGVRYVDCALSRGLSARAGCTAADLKQMDAWMKTHLGVGVSGRTWRVQVYNGLVASFSDQSQRPSRNTPTGS